MRRILLVVLGVAVIANFAYAGDAKPMTKAGDKALLFTISGLGSFGVGGVSTFTIPASYYANNQPPNDVLNPGMGVKYYLSNNLALRGVISLLGTSKTTKIPPIGTVAQTDEKESGMALGIMPGVQYHLMQTGSVTGYAGAQAVLGIGSTSSTPSVAQGAIAYERKSSFTAFGASAFFGAEWYPWENISLGAEYQLGFTTYSGKVEQGNAAGTQTTDAPSVFNFGIGSFAVVLGVNI